MSRPLAFFYEVIMKVVINFWYGGFGISKEARQKLLDIGWHEDDIEGLYASEIDRRSHYTFVKLVDEMGTASWGDCAKLKIVEIPDDVEVEICEQEGAEWISEKCRKWS